MSKISRWAGYVASFFAIVFALLVLVGCSTTEQTKNVTSTSYRSFTRNWAGTVSWAPERDPDLRSLLKARYEAAVSAYQTEKMRSEAGTSTIELVLRLSDLVVDAEIDLAETPEQVIQAMEKHLKTTKEFELAAQQRIRLTLAPSSEQDLTRCWRLSTELELLRAKRYFTCIGQSDREPRL